MKTKFFSLLIVILLVSCGPKTPTPTEVIPPTAAPVVATNTPRPVLPTATATTTLTPTVEPTATAAPSPTPSIIGPDNFPADVNPLTGLKVANPSLLERRPIAIKVNIAPRASYRPPWGLTFADLVFDYYHNAGYSRFHAIYLGTDANAVGAIRSARLLDASLIAMYKSDFAYGSADPIVNSRLMNADFGNRLVLEGVKTLCPSTVKNPLCRFEPSGSNLLLGSTSAISQYITAKGVENGRQDLNGMAFAEAIPQNGTAANQVFVSYSRDDYLRWDYDPASGRYLRFQDNKYRLGENPEVFAPLIDQANNQQISAANVVVLFVDHEYYRQPPSEIIDILLSGSGKAIAFRDGQMYEVQWNRPGVDSVLFLTNPDGTPFPFKPGNTWFQVIGKTSNSLKPGDGVFRYEFATP